MLTLNFARSPDRFWNTDQDMASDWMYDTTRVERLMLLATSFFLNYLKRWETKERSFLAFISSVFSFDYAQDAGRTINKSTC